MEDNQFAKLANYTNTKTHQGKSQTLAKALDTLAELLNIEFGSLTVHFHKGRWSPRIEIQKNVVKDLKD